MKRGGKPLELETREAAEVAARRLATDIESDHVTFHVIEKS
jgi:hypothetical protein